MSYKVFVDFEMAPISKRFKAERYICIQEIIQIGAVLLDDDNNEVAEFKRNITPEYVDILPSYLIDLLNVSFKEIEGKCNFEQGIRDFINWMYLYSDDFYIYAWSNNDFDQIVKESKLKDIKVDERFYYMLGSWFDLQEEFDGLIGSKKNTGLKKALELCGLTFAGREHDSLIDSRNTAVVYKEIQNKERFAKQVNYIKNATSARKESVCMLGSLIDFSKFNLI